MSRVEITDISAKDQEFVESMRLEAQSERERRGAVIKSQGEAQSIKLDAEAQAMRIRLEADAMLYKAEKEAEAIRITAEAQAWAIATKGAALETEGAKFAQQSEILRAQVDALHSIGSADNSKIVVVPADLIQSASSLISLTRKSGFN
jgi:regulator of protease activity HflC (stomatin/prohibitin superfamily)